MYAFFRWLALLPVSFAAVLAAWAVAPIAPRFAHDFSLKGTRLWWCTTPDTDLRGDRAHQERFGHKNSYWQQVWWIFRNPAVNFQREWLGVHCEPTDAVVTKGKANAQTVGGACFQRVVRNGRTIAWMVFACLPYGGAATGKAFRILLGWKTWDFCVKDPLQLACRVTIWKSFIPKEN